MIPQAKTQTRPAPHTRMLAVTAVLLSAMLGALSAKGAELKLANVFGNHMVVQRDQPIIFWGTADPGAKVTGEYDGARATATADDDGRWQLSLPALPASADPHRFVFRAGDQATTLNDVLIGDVWVCSGQSNMFFRVEQSERGDEFIPKADNPNIRLLQIDKVWDRQPQGEASTMGWRYCDPAHVAKFTAVGYHFGRILQKETGVPIGLIHSSWGGTPLEAWTPMPTLKARPDVYAARLASLAEYDLSDEEAKRVMDEAEATFEDFTVFAWKHGIGQDAGWNDPNFDDTAWPTMHLPGYIDGQLGSLDGIIWFRKAVTLSPAQANAAHATLDIGKIVDYDEIYVNGTMVGSTYVDAGDGRRIVRKYDIPSGVLKPGKNVIAVRLMNVRSSGGVTPDSGAFALVTDDTSTPLAGDWKYAVGFNASDHGGFPRPAAYAVPVGRVFRRPAVLYNAMIAPLTRLGVKGVIWYQGESNAGRGDEYAQMFPDMINAWRDAWRTAHDDNAYRLPFYFVQLPNFRAAVDGPHESSWAAIRDAQRTTLDHTEDTGMAITIGLGNPGNIHPTNKVPVAQRLARVALNDLYGEHVDNPMGPLPVAAKANANGSVTVTWESAKGLKTDDGKAPATFELAGSDGAFHTATATIKGDTTVITCPEVKEPKTVRYAWADNPQTNLVNAEGLPASTFELEVE